MLALIMALALGAGGTADDTSVTCALQAEGVTRGGDRGPERFTARCPSDHPDAQAIQATADAALGAVSLPLPEPAGSHGQFLYGYADSLIMTRGPGPGGWSPAPGQYLVNVEPVLSPGLITRDARYAACALDLRPDAAGVPVAPRVRCLSGEATPRVRQTLEPAMLIAAGRMRFAPSATPYCTDCQVLIRARVYDIDARRFEAPAEVTDADDLPNLCVLDEDALAAYTGLAELPVTAQCRTAGNIQRRRVTGFHLVCPDDAPEAARLQAYADDVAALTGGAVDINPGRYGRLSEHVSFAFDQGAWTLERPATLTRHEPRYPSGASARGLDGVCALAIEIEADGRPRDARVSCRAVRRNGVVVSGAQFERSAREAVMSWFWLMPPGAVGGCATTKLDFFTTDGPMAHDSRPWLSAPVPGAPQCED